MRNGRYTEGYVCYYLKKRDIFLIKSEVMYYFCIFADNLQSIILYGTFYRQE